MSVISAGTTSTTAFKVTGDTTGTLQLQTGAVPTTAINISASQVVTFPATTTLDFTGSLLLGDGSASAPTLAHSGDTNTGIYFPGADQIAITTAGSQKLFVGTSFVVNEGGLDFDTRIEGDTDANLVFVDASADAVGIGTNTPGGKFNIVKAKSGTGAESYDMLRLNLTGTAAIGDSSDIVWYSGSTKVASINGILGADNALYGTLTFSTRSYNTDTLVEAVRINNRSNVGIGTTNPASRLDVTGAFGTGTTAFTIYNNSGASASNIARIDFRVNNTFNGNEQVAAIWGINPNAGANNGGALVFATSDNGTATTPSERARITAAGNFGIGTSSPSSKLEVYQGDLKLFDGYKLAWRYSAGDSTPYNWIENGYSGSSGILYRSGSWTGSQSITCHNFQTYTSNAWVSRLTILQDGSVSIPGSLSKGSGSFRIDHPLKPDTHQLVHSFIEGPQADLIYRGKVTLVNGQAVVNIDAASGMTEGTFVALCREVQCFTSNESDWDAVRGSVTGNLLTIECQNPNSSATVSWMVVGERQDKHMYDTGWTDENGKVIVEPLKELH